VCLRGWSHGSPNKWKMAAAAIFNSLTSGKCHCTKFYGKMQRGYDHVTKNWNRKLIHVTSSNEIQKHKCVDLSDYTKYLNQIWYRAQIPHYQYAGMAKFAHNLKIQDGDGRHFEFWKNDNYSGQDKDICTKFYVKMRHGHAQMTTWPKVETGS